MIYVYREHDFRLIERVDTHSFDTLVLIRSLPVLCVIALSLSHS